MNNTIYVGGRYPSGFAMLDPSNMLVEVKSTKDDVIIRIDDRKNLSFWMEVIITKEELKKILQQSDGIANAKE